MKYDIRDLRTSLSPLGDVTWFSAVLDDSGTFNGIPIRWKDARWTGVLEKSDKEWKIAQMHPYACRIERINIDHIYLYLKVWL